MNYVIPYFLKNQLESACDKLVKESTQCWKQVNIMKDNEIYIYN